SPRFKPRNAGMKDEGRRMKFDFGFSSFILHPSYFILAFMRVAILSPEAVPFAKVGGLADVSGALTKALHAEAVDSFLILPFYDLIDQSLVSGVAIENLEVRWRGNQPRIRVLKSNTLNAPTYRIDAPCSL